MPKSWLLGSAMAVALAAPALAADEAPTSPPALTLDRVFGNPDLSGSAPRGLRLAMSDDNVVFENSTLFAARVQAEDRPFQMMFYPGYTHRSGGLGISEHLWHTTLNFLDTNVVNRPASWPE